MRSQFEGGEKHGKTFGVAREAYAKVYLKTSPYMDGAAPGPGAYNTIQPTGRNTSKYTMRLKTAPQSDNYTSKIVPGPGYYALPSAINPTGKFTYAKFRNSAVALFSPPSLKRFTELRNGYAGVNSEYRPAVSRTWKLQSADHIRAQRNLLLVPIQVFVQHKILTCQSRRYRAAY